MSEYSPLFSGGGPLSDLSLCLLTLANHSYVDLSQVGRSSSGNGVQCITDLSTCCRITDGTHRGDWFFPSGSRLSFTGDVYESCGAQGVDL